MASHINWLGVLRVKIRVHDRMLNNVKRRKSKISERVTLGMVHLIYSDRRAPVLDAAIFEDLAMHESLKPLVR